MKQFLSFSGIITMIEEFMIDQRGTDSGCYLLMTLENREGTITNFIIEPDTYFVEHVKLAMGDLVTGYYDGTAAVPLIYPPRLRAIVMARYSRRYNVKVDFFDRRLLSSDGDLRLNIGPSTVMELENGQTFLGNPANRNLIVQYGATTRSIPAQTTPMKVVVMCGR
jgi:hypothetical protein